MSWAEARRPINHEVRFGPHADIGQVASRLRLSLSIARQLTGAQELLPLAVIGYHYPK